ncbi:MAG: hypothetical protein ABC606_00895 [Candidatus Methanosuratincola petrocarbonis]
MSPRSLVSRTGTFEQVACQYQRIPPAYPCSAAGYNPTDPVHAIMTAVTSVTLFAMGLTAYSKHCWRRG